MTVTVDIKKIETITVRSFKELSQYYIDYEKNNPLPLMNSLVWLSLWFTRFWQANWQLQSIVILHASKVIAIAPFYYQNKEQWTQPTILYPLGQGEPEHTEVASEYLDILISPGHEEIIYKELSNYLQSMKVDKIIWRASLSNSHIGRLIKQAFKESTPNTSTRYITSTQHWSLEKLSKNTRSRYKRSLNQLKKCNAEFIWVQPSQFKEYYQILMVFHQKRWQEKGTLGAFFHSDFNDFHWQLLNQKNATAMSAIVIDGQAIAINYYLKDTSTLYFYQSGWHEEEYAKFSLGSALHLWSIQHCEQPHYDFMMGRMGDSYKAKFGCEQIPMINIDLNLTPWKVFLSRIINKIFN